MVEEKRNKRCLPGKKDCIKICVNDPILGGKILSILKKVGKTKLELFLLLGHDRLSRNKNKLESNSDGTVVLWRKHRHLSACVCKFLCV